MSLETCQGILLRSHPYSDTSQIFRFLTAERGIVSVIGKGTRSRSGKGGGGPQTFCAGALTFHFRPNRELHTLRDFHGDAKGLALGRDLPRFLGASLTAELVLAHRMEEADAPLFEWVHRVFDRLGSVPDPEVPGWVVAGGWRTLALLGYPPETDRCVRCGTALGEEGVGKDSELAYCRFDVVAGGLSCPSCGVDRSLPRIGAGARADLVAMLDGTPPQILRGTTAHVGILEAFAHRHLDPRRALQSFEPLRGVLNKLESSG